MDKGKKKDLNPCSLEKCFSQAIGNEPLSIKSISDFETIIEVSRESENEVLPTVTEQSLP